jgi:DNA-directed RNA polymerase specialized sigma24 family protein
LEIPTFDTASFLQHLQSGADPAEAPGLAELLAEVEQRARQKIRISCNLPSADIEEGAADVMVTALEKIQSRDVLDQYNLEKGHSLAGYLANFAVQRTIDAIRSSEREARLARKLAMGEGEIDTSFRDVAQMASFRPHSRNKTTTPLNALGAQLGNRLDWSDHTDLESQFRQGLHPHLQTWRQRLVKRRGEGQTRIDSSIQALEKSVNHALRLASDPGADLEEGNGDAFQRSLKQQKVVERRQRKFRHCCIEETWFPLTSEDLQELLSLGSVSNAQQVRSRARRQLLELLTTGDDDNDQGIGEFFRTIKLDPQEEALEDQVEGGGE